MKLTEANSFPENKLLILYILNKVKDTISNSVLTKIYFSVNDINYFYYSQYLSDLLSKNFITSYIEDNICYYSITPQGLDTLNNLDYLIPSVMLVAADKALENITKGLKYELSIAADFIILDVDKINVKCSISEGNSKLFSVEVFAGSMDQARKIADNWKENALKNYPKIINILTNEQEQI